MIKNKGIFEFCEIARKVREIRKDITFVWAGAESQIKINNIQNYINRGDVVYLGELENVKEIISKCKIYVSTSYREGFPRTIMEAMAMGKPVFATNVIGNKELVINYTTGLLLPNKDIDLFSKTILFYIDNTALLESFGKNARKICIKKYDSDLINDIVLNVLESSAQD